VIGLPQGEDFGRVQRACPADGALDFSAGFGIGDKDIPEFVALKVCQLSSTSGYETPGGCLENYSLRLRIQK
jgi:hypothetical protein